MSFNLIKAFQSKDVVASVKHYLAKNEEDNRVKVDVVCLVKVNPSGKMPFTLTFVLEQSPAHALGN